MDANTQFYPEDETDSEYQGIPAPDPGLISYIRCALAKSPMGSLLTSHIASPSTADKGSTTSSQQSTLEAALLLASGPPSTVPQRSGHGRSLSLADVKRVVSKIAQHTRRSRSGSLTSLSSPEGPTKPHTSRRRAHTVSSTAPTPTYHQDPTPPLTPDSSSLVSSHNSSFSGLIDKAMAVLETNNTPNRTREESQRIREGKRPQRELPYDTLMADISSDWDPPVATSTPTRGDRVRQSGRELEDDSEEWFGLDYALELSRVSQTECVEDKSPGEFSKSPKSWAKMHRGWVHPNLEEKAYRKWLKWHNALERVEERRRIERTFDFLRYSKRKAAIHVEMMAFERYIQLHSEDSRYNENLQRAKEQLALLAYHRHDATVDIRVTPLRHARSLSCLAQKYRP